MSGDVVARAKAALKGVTGDEWGIEYDSCDCGDGYGCPHGEWPYQLCGPVNQSATAHNYSAEYLRDYGDKVSEFCELSASDAEFIAAARSLVPELVDYAENLQATIFMIQEARGDYDAALHRREHGAVAADRFMSDVFAALDIHTAVIERAGIEP